MTHINDMLEKMYKIIKFDCLKVTPRPQFVSDYPESLKTCHDVFLFLTDVITKPIFIDRNNKAFKNWKKIGELHIYADGREMNFIKTR